MYCNLCQNHMEKGIKLLGTNVCEHCFKDLTDTSVYSVNYDYYMEMVKEILENYIYDKKITL